MDNVTYMAQHARLSASGAHKWMACPVSLALEEKIPNRSNKYADEGTAAHGLAAKTLSDGVYRALNYEGQDLELGYTATADMCDHVQKYVDLVRDHAQHGELFVEQRVDYSSYVEVPNQFGTSDSVIVGDGEITIIDLKYGMGVRVDAQDNEQLLLYALGSMHEFEMFGPFHKVTTIISQPRLDHISTAEYTWADAMFFSLAATDAAKVAVDIADVFAENTLEEVVNELGLKKHLFNPGEEQCRFCRAKALCPGLTSKIEEVMEVTFQDLTSLDNFDATSQLSKSESDILSLKMKAVPLIEEFTKAVRAEVAARLFDNQKVPGFKLVAGRKGDRTWSDKDQAEALLKQMRLKLQEMYTLKLISPTQAEKLMARDTPRRWAKAQKLIVRPDGKPSVAPASDPRPEYEAIGTEFSDLTEE